MLIPIELEASIFHEEICDFNIARVNLTKERIAWIKKMERLVKRHDLAYVADYDGAALYFNRQDEDEPENITPYDGRTECDMIVVRKSGFYWKGCLKGTSIHFETDVLSMDDLNKLIRFYKKPIEEMPKHINDEDYSFKEIALRRMKGE
jgi:hypothetical protein